MKKPELTIVKIGGNIIEAPGILEDLLHRFSQLNGFKILVHGGGKKATEVETRLGITSEKFEGRRITGDQSLDVMIMVYAGLVNKKIVAALQANHCNAIGMSGADGSSIQALKRPVTEVDFGFVGDVEKVNTETIDNLLRAQLTPVFCALTHDGSGQLFNTNADTIASELAIALSRKYVTKLYYCFEKKGVLLDMDDEESVIRHLDKEHYKKLLSDEVISDGMLPKLQTCFKALESDVSEIFIGNENMLDANTDIYTRITL